MPLKLTAFAPENGWLEYKISFWGNLGLFSVAFAVSFRESNIFPLKGSHFKRKVSHLRGTHPETPSHLQHRPRLAIHVASKHVCRWQTGTTTHDVVKTPSHVQAFHSKEVEISFMVYQHRLVGGFNPSEKY